MNSTLLTVVVLSLTHFGAAKLTVLDSCCNLESNPKQPSCKKVCGPQKGYGEKRCEIQGGGQEMAVMVG